MTDSSEPIHPGKILYEMAMEPLGVSRNKLARDIDVPVGRISDIVAGKRGITPDTALRLGKYFGTSAEMWMQFQTDHDLHVARRTVWLEIAPRVRELEPGEVGAVAPVTEMDNHPEAADDYVPENAPEDSEDNESRDGDLSVDVDTPQAAPPQPDDGEEKWWSAPLSEAVADPTEAEHDAPTESEAPVNKPSEIADPAEETTAETGEWTTERTLTLEVKPTATTSEPLTAPPVASADADDTDAGDEQTFEIDVHPSATDSVAAEIDEGTAQAESPRREFTVEVVRDTPDSATEIAKARGAAAPDSPEAAESDDEAFAFELGEDDIAGEVPGDAFDGEFDSEFDSEFEDAFESEATEQVDQEEYVVAIARTGTDDFAPPDPPHAAPGLDATAGTSEMKPAASGPAPSGSEIGGMSPANWSSALRSELGVEAGSAEPETAEGSAAAEGLGAPEPGDVLAVPLPSEVEPALEGPVPPWPPVDHDDMAVSLDIPDPKDARKLFEYDD